jgi:predicted GIY-YIG superfamily endonuclease
MLHTYILTLEGNKYYVGSIDMTRDTPDSVMKRHLTGKDCVWTRMYKPIRFIIGKTFNEILEIEKIVIYLMDEFGINNVRGGIFSEVELSEMQKLFIDNIIWNYSGRCYKCGSEQHKIFECPQNNDVKFTHNDEEKQKSEGEDKSLMQVLYDLLVGGMEQQQIPETPETPEPPKTPVKKENGRRQESIPPPTPIKRTKMTLDERPVNIHDIPFMTPPNTPVQKRDDEEVKLSDEDAHALLEQIIGEMIDTNGEYSEMMRPIVNPKSKHDKKTINIYDYDKIGFNVRGSLKMLSCEYFTEMMNYVPKLREIIKTTKCKMYKNIPYWDILTEMKYFNYITDYIFDKDKKIQIKFDTEMSEVLDTFYEYGIDMGRLNIEDVYVTHIIEEKPNQYITHVHCVQDNNIIPQSVSILGKNVLYMIHDDEFGGECMNLQLYIGNVPDWIKNMKKHNKRRSKDGIYKPYKNGEKEYIVYHW